MNRLSRDTTAPRRLTKPKRATTQPRAEDGLVAAEADLVRSAWDHRNRVSPF